MQVGSQPVMAPPLQILIDIVEYCCGGVEFGVGAAQLELSPLRGQIIEAPPASTGGAGLCEIVGGAVLQRG